MKEILVPFDFSKPAIHAFRFALDIASQAHANVSALHVIDLPVLTDGIVTPIFSYEKELLNELKEKVQRQYQALKEKYNLGNTNVHFMVQFGQVSNMILQHIRKHNIDLVVMGSHGVSGLREFFIGSNAEKLVRTSPVPVLVVKDYYKGPIKNIVFPSDLENQQDLIQKIKSLQQFFKAHLHIVWINTPLNFTVDSVTLKKLEDFAKIHQLENYTLSVFNHYDEEQGIIEFSNYIKGDLIAIGTHGRRGISHLLNGSLAEDVVNHNRGLVWTYAVNHAEAEVNDKNYVS